MPTSLKPLKLAEGKVPPVISPETEIIPDDAGNQQVYYDGELIGPVGRKRALPVEYCHAEPAYNTGRCRMIKSSGDRCKQPVRTGWSVCRFHGAGTERDPGGSAAITGRFSKYLPTRFIETYEAHIADPDYLNLSHEMALVDTRLAELLGLLDGAETKAAWAKIRGVGYKLNLALSHESIEDLREAVETCKHELYEAIAIRTADHELWSSIMEGVEQRRKLADTERRRIVDAKKYLTLTEANAMMAFVIDAVMKNVASPQERMRISEQMRKFGAKSPLQLSEAVPVESEDDVIDMLVDEDDIQESV